MKSRPYMRTSCFVLPSYGGIAATCSKRGNVAPLIASDVPGARDGSTTGNGVLSSSFGHSLAAAI